MSIVPMGQIWDTKLQKCAFYLLSQAIQFWLLVVMSCGECPASVPWKVLEKKKGPGIVCQVLNFVVVSRVGIEPTTT